MERIAESWMNEEIAKLKVEKNWVGLTEGSHLSPGAVHLLMLIAFAAGIVFGALAFLPHAG